MLAAKAEVPPMTTEKHQHAAFFRQSGWMMIAALVGGAMTYGLHFLARSPRLPEKEYAIGGTLLALTIVIPAMPLQMVFSQQVAAALALNRQRQVAGMIRLTWLWTSVLCLVASMGLAAFHEPLARTWHLSHLAALWWTLPVLFFAFWLPMFSGVLQGQQDFFWVGWVTILGGAGRLGLAALFVVVLDWNSGSTGMMIGVFAGFGLATLIAAWQTRDLWTLPGEPFDKRTLLSQILPLMLGFGAVQFIFSADTMFAKAYFGEEEMAYYFAAGTMSRALMWLVLPLAQVMFPKIVHSTAKSEESNLQRIVLLGTLVLGVCSALGLCILGPWVVRIPYPAHYAAPTLALLPWYAWAMVPLTLGNVMINNLLARSSFRIVLPLLVLAGIYAFALICFHKSQVMILQVLGAFNLLLVAVCLWFTWDGKRVKELKRLRV
jgi:O-antigen/teichoic acid export membrane protein